MFYSIFVCVNKQLVTFHLAFIVTGPAEHGEKRAYQACCQSLERLGVARLDLYLIHWPGVQKLKHDDPQNKQLRKQSWLVMEQLYRDGEHQILCQ